MDIRSGSPLVRLPFCPARGVDTGVVSGAGESEGLWELKESSNAVNGNLLSFGPLKLCLLSQ